jgi:hypothetical protein
MATGVSAESLCLTDSFTGARQVLDAGAIFAKYLKSAPELRNLGVQTGFSRLVRFAGSVRRVQPLRLG